MATMVGVRQDAGRAVRPHHSEVDLFPGSPSVLRFLEAVELRRLLAGSSVLKASRGQILYCEGELLNYLYVVQSGSVKMTRNSEEGKELIVSLAGRGDLFGALIRPIPAPNLAQPLEPTTAYALPLPAVRRAARASADFSLALLELSEAQARTAQATAARLAFDTVPLRLAHILLQLSDPHSGTLHFPLNQTEIANLIGSSRETVCSALNRFRRDGLLSIVKGRIRILDRERLAAAK